ncbi:hypothetical protein CYMTET_33995, partial [Cymbomonas tetramitiformis]
VEEGSVCFVASAHTFDPSLGDFFATLCVGGALALAPRRTLFCSLGACLAITGATHVLTTPSLFATVDVLEKLPALRVVALGGEAMPTRLAQQWASRVTLINTYGVTECCVYQACAVLSADASSTKALGSPLPGNRLLLVAGDGNDVTKLVPDGSNEEGEIWIAGAQVGKGYLNRAELTEARFVEHRGIGPCFRTGDLAVAAPGGWELVGRRDTQVKIRGRRVEVDEVEHVLLCAVGPASPSPASSSVTTAEPRGPSAGLLADAAVTANHGQLVAWCVPGDGLGDASSLDAGLLQDVLRGELETRLPEHMVPARFVFIPALPTTSSGKVARGELATRPLPEVVDDSALPLSSGWEVAVMEAWQEEMGWAVRSAGAHFTELGGQSLGALRVCHRLYTAWVAQGGETSRLSQDPREDEAAGPAAAATAGGEFGELLGPLSPVELLKRPRLCAFAMHLQHELGDYPGGNSAGDELGVDDGTRPSRPEEGAGELLYRAVASGSTGIAAFLLERAPVNAEGGRPVSERVLSSARAGASGRTKNRSKGGKGKRGTQGDHRVDLHQRPAVGADTGAYLPLHVACANGHEDMVRMLLDYGVSATAPTRYGVTPLHMALTAGQGAMPVVQLLLAAKVGLASRDDDKQSVLHHAARSGAPLKVLNVLLERMHADKAVQAAEKCLGTQLVDWTDRWRRTALHWAVVNGHRAVVVWLMEAGANVKLRDEKETALEIAERRARCGASERPDNARASTWGDIAKLLGGSGSTKNLKKSAA